MQFKRYELSGLGVAVAICNDRPGTAAEYEEILRRNRVHEPSVTRTDLSALDGWPDDLREAFAAGPDEKHIVVNRLMVEAGCVPRLATHDDLPPHLHFGPDSGPVAARIKSMTAGGLALGIATLGGTRLGSCARPGCESVFVDTTRGGTRRHCSVRCANRVRVARHRTKGQASEVGS